MSTDKHGNVTYQPPIVNCEHLNAVDGCCEHPDAMTPECHPWADCPPLQEQIATLQEQVKTLDMVLAGFVATVREARNTLVAIRDIAEDDCGNLHSSKIARLCETWLMPMGGK